jgi:hypothetical protein
MSHDEIMNDLQYPQPGKRRDMVEVVRCRDCQYCDSFITARSADGLTELMEYRCKDFHTSVMPDEYCSRGERRDG